MFYYRKYDDYDEYLKHQAAKLDIRIKTRKSRPGHNFDEIKDHFKDRFELYIDYLKEGGNVICLGARLGMEVAAFRELGFPKSVGIDLNPGPWQDKDDPFVIKGDFQDIPFDDNSFDAAYTNAVDHCYNIETLIKDTYRVLKPNGIFILEIDHLGHPDDPTYAHLRPKKRPSKKRRLNGLITQTKYEACAYDEIDDIIDALAVSFDHVITLEISHNYPAVICSAK